MIEKTDRELIELAAEAAGPDDGNKVWLDGDCPFGTTRRVIVQAAALTNIVDK